MVASGGASFIGPADSKRDELALFNVMRARAPVGRRLVPVLLTSFIPRHRWDQLRCS